MGYENQGCRSEDISYGVTFLHLTFGYEQLGFTRQIVNNQNGDVYQIKIVGTTKQIQSQIKAFIKVAEEYNGNVNVSEYYKFRPNTTEMKTEGFLNDKRIATFGLLAIRSGEQLFSSS